MDTSSTIQTAVEAARVPGLSVASAVLAILVVALSTYGRRCRHPALRLIISGASIAFIPLTSSAAMAMRLSRDCDACDGDGSCEYCSVEFHLAARATDSGQTLEVTAMDLRSTDPKVCPVDQADAAGDHRQVDRGLHYGPLCSLLLNETPKY